MFTELRRVEATSREEGFKHWQGIYDNTGVPSVFSSDTYQIKKAVETHICVGKYEDSLCDHEEYSQGWLDGHDEQLAVAGQVEVARELQAGVDDGAHAEPRHAHVQVEAAVAGAFHVLFGNRDKISLYTYGQVNRSN